MPERALDGKATTAKAGAGRRVLFKTHEPPAGSRPGTLVIPEDADHPRFRAVLYDTDSLEELEVDSVEGLVPLLERGKKVWIDVQGLGSEAVLLALGRLFTIHPLALEDAVHVGQRPSTTVYEAHQQIVGRSLRVGTVPGEIEFEQMSLFVGSTTLLTIQERHGDDLEVVRERLRLARGPIRKLGVDYLAYAILDTAIDQFFPILEKMGDLLEELEVEVLRDPTPAVLGEVNHAKKELLMLRRALWPQREVINTLIRDPSQFISEETQVYFRDSYEHCIQLLDVVETYREVASSLMSTYLSAVSNKTNDVMKVLTIMSSIFIPLGFMAGLYGMNFQWMPELSWRWGYPTLLSLMLTVAFTMLVFFRVKGWLGGGRSRRRRRRLRLLKLGRGS